MVKNCVMKGKCDTTISLKNRKSALHQNALHLLIFALCCALTPISCGSVVGYTCHNFKNIHWDLVLFKAKISLGLEEEWFGAELTLFSTCT